VYGEGVDALAIEWEHHIDSLPLLPNERIEATERFRHTSVFVRPCAHVIANLRAAAIRAEPKEAVGYYREICTHLGNDPSAQIDFAFALKNAGFEQEFLNLTDALTEEKSLTRQQRTGLLEQRGMVFWQRGHLAEAKAMFEQALELGTNLGSARMNWVRLWALAQKPEDLRLYLDFLAGKLGPVVAVLQLDRAWQRAPKDPTLPYLVGRQIALQRAPRLALSYLEKNAPHPFLPIEAERLRLVAEAQAELRQWQAAINAMGAYRELVPSSGERERAADAIERYRFRLSQQKP
jgi:tetratricopeptide (TPR) repeat protein